MIAPTSFFADYGCHVRILEEARTLQRLGHTVCVVTYANGRDLVEIDIHRTLPIPWRRHYEVGSSRHKIAFDALLGLKTLELLARRRFDVIHGHLHEGALIGLVLGRLFRIPVAFDFQGSLTEEMIDHRFLQRDSRVYPPLRRIEEWIDRNAPAIFTSSAHARSILLDDFGVRPDRIKILPDCVNTASFRPAADFDPEELRQMRGQLGIAEDARVIVYLGLLAEYQGTGHLLQAFARILAHHPKSHLLLMGFPGVDAYTAQAVDLGIRHAVTFTGRIPYEDAPRHIALGHVAAAPKLSLTESAGKLLNYMAAALPTVAYNTPVAQEYLGQDGYLAEVGNIDSLTAHLEAALYPTAAAQKDPTAAGIRLRRRAMQHFEWLQAGQNIVDTYAELLGHKLPLSTPGKFSTVRRSGSADPLHTPATPTPK
ncbi:MAG: glycosyltransferase family 4 protein [Litorilinea sp.]